MRDLQPRIEGALGKLAPNTTWGVAVLDHEGEPIVDLNASAQFPALSLNKLGVALAFDQQGFPLDEGYVYKPDLHQRGGEGSLQYFPPNYLVKFGQALRLMLAESDNTATALLVEFLGGPEIVNMLLDSNEQTHQLPISRLQPVQVEGKHGRYTYGPTTAYEAARYMQLATGRPVGRSLYHSHFWWGARSAIERGLSIRHPAEISMLRVARGPVNSNRPYDHILNTERPTSPFATKAGIDGENRHEVIVLPYGSSGTGPGAPGLTLAMLSEGYPPDLPEDEHHPAHQVHAALGRIVWQAARVA